MNGVFVVKKQYRIKKEKDIAQMFKHGKSCANRHFIIYRLNKKQAHFRLGLSVSKKLGNAVVRNKVKRYIREVFNQLEDNILNEYDIMIIARKGVEKYDFVHFKKSLKHGLKLAKLLHHQDGKEGMIANDTKNIQRCNS